MPAESKNSFDPAPTLTVGDTSYDYFRIDAVDGVGAAAVQPEGAAREPAAHRGRQERHRASRSRRWPTGSRTPSPTPRSSSPRPGSSCRTSPACRRSSTSPRCARRSSTSAATRRKINPLAPAELVIDHSVIADLFGTPDAFERNVELEYERNNERYQFLRWGQTAFDEFKVVPPGTGIVHQVNIEYLARVVFAARRRAPTRTRSSAPTRTPRWSTASACSAGASAASRPRRRCSASRSAC